MLLAGSVTLSCAGEQVPATVEVEVTREVEVEVLVEATRDVEVTRIAEIPATVEVEVPVEITREVEVTRVSEVPVTVEVEVTREVGIEVTRVVTATPIPTNTPEPTPAVESTVEPELGHARSNPVPFGSESSPMVGDVTIFVINVERGWNRHKEINQFNDDPERGHEYLLVGVQFQDSGDPNASTSYSDSGFDVIGDRGVVYGTASVIGEDELHGEIYGGSTLRGNLFFEVPSDEKGLILRYEEPWCFRDCPAVYYALEAE